MMMRLIVTTTLCFFGRATDIEVKTLAFDRDRDLCHTPLVGAKGRAITHPEALAILTQDAAHVCDYLDLLDAPGTINWRLLINEGKRIKDKCGYYHTIQPHWQKATLASCCASGHLRLIKEYEAPPEGVVPGVNWFPGEPTLREDIDSVASEPTRVAIMTWLLDHDPEAAWGDYVFDPTANYRGDLNLPDHTIKRALFHGQTSVVETMLMHASADKYIADGEAADTGEKKLVETSSHWREGDEPFTSLHRGPVNVGKLKECIETNLEDSRITVDLDCADKCNHLADTLFSLRQRARMGAEQALLEAVFRTCTKSSCGLARDILDGWLGHSKDYRHMAACRLSVRDPWLSADPLRAMAEQPNPHDMTWASFAGIPGPDYQPFVAQADTGARHHNRKYRRRHCTDHYWPEE